MTSLYIWRKSAFSEVNNTYIVYDDDVHMNVKYQLNLILLGSGMSITLTTPSSTGDSNMNIVHTPHHHYQSPTTRSFSHLTSLASAQTLSTTHSNLSNKASKASLLKGLPPTHHVVQSQPDLRGEGGFPLEDNGNGGNVCHLTLMDHF
jgi:hypothetical protein